MIAIRNILFDIPNRKFAVSLTNSAELFTRMIVYHNIFLEDHSIVVH